MEEYKIRLGTTLRFDMNKELDLVKNVKDLTDKHKLGSYINALLRYVWENPEKFKGSIVDPYINGLSMRREAYFNHIEGEVKECKKALDYMYAEMITLNTAAKVGSTIGLVESTSEFLNGLEYIEGYINKLKSNYDLGNMSGMYESAKVSKAEEVANKAADILVKMMVAKNFGRGTSNGTVTNTAGSIGRETVNTPVDSSFVSPDSSQIKENEGIETSSKTYEDNTDVVVGIKDKNDTANAGDSEAEDTIADNIDIDLISEFCNM